MIKTAIKLAQEMPHQKHRLVAIITDKRNRILSIGQNSFTKTHPLQAHFAIQVKKEKAIYLHSEIAALVNLPFKSKPNKIFVARVSKQGKSRLAKPCAICQKALTFMNIQEIHYTKG